MSLHDVHVSYSNNVKICTENKIFSKVTTTDILFTLFTQKGFTHKYE